MYKGSIKALLVTILAVSLVLPFSISTYADGITNFGDVNISGGNNTVSTATGNITMDSGTIQIGSTNDSQQIVQNTASTNTKLDTLISTINSHTTIFNNILGGIAFIYDNLTAVVVQQSNTRTFTFAGTSRSYTLGQMNLGGSVYYSNLRGMIQYHFNSLLSQLYYPYVEVVQSDAATYKTLTFNGLPFVVVKSAFNTYTYDDSNDVINFGISYAYTTFVSYLGRMVNVTFVNYLNAHIAYLADTWYRWYSPNISAANSQFWIAFNTDTEVYDHVNLSTVFGYITWYLGQLYIQGNEAAADISQSVDDMATAFTDLESKENQINTNIKNSLNSVDSFFNLPVIASGSVVIGWLQYMWVSLGMFQGVTIIAWALIILTIVTGFYKVKRITV